MSKVEVVLPKLGESIIEATILKWLKKPGDKVEADETLLEIATDKVDSEVPAPVSGTLVETRYKEGDVVPVGAVIAIIESEVAEEEAPISETPVATTPEVSPTPTQAELVEQPTAVANAEGSKIPKRGPSGRFYSPLVRNIAAKEGISLDELEQIPGTGKEGRVTKKDILQYLEQKKQAVQAPQTKVEPTPSAPTPTPQAQPSVQATPTEQELATVQSYNGDVEIIEMDRMRQLIAKHMAESWHTIPRVTSFVEVDVTKIWKWRQQIKDQFQKKYGVKLTFTPIFFQATAQALRDFPRINSSIDGTKIIIHKRIHIGMATALPDGNLIVPVIKDADQLNLVGLAHRVNDLASRARAGKLQPDEIQGGTFTITNVGSYGDLCGTPIINPPQTAILGTGLIRKVPAVIETPEGDTIGIRYKMFLCLSYDHRVIDGYLGGSFANRVKHYLEHFNTDQAV